MARWLPSRRFHLSLSVLAAFLVTLAGSSVFAIDDNLTKGATNNHVFESGIWGENIDTLNGGLNLTIPLGPAYGVSADLSYQLRLNYSSKIWHRDAVNISLGSRSRLSGRGQAGLGFTLQMGRYYKHADAADCPTYTYVFEDQSGAAHPEPGSKGSTDGSFLKIWSGGVVLPGGTRMTLGHQVVDRPRTTPGRTTIEATTSRASRARSGIPISGWTSATRARWPHRIPTITGCVT